MIQIQNTDALKLEFDIGTILETNPLLPDEVLPDILTEIRLSLVDADNIDKMELLDIVRRQVLIQEYYVNKRDTIKDFKLITDERTCYRKCKDINNRVDICLDWREICDNKIDCFDLSDEEYCFELETNRCNDEFEYRCRNGLCIDKSFSFDNYPDCLDYSDETNMLDRSLYDNCFVQFRPDCEDHFCGSTYFSCGDGQCIENLKESFTNNQCYNTYDKAYLSQISEKNDNIYHEKCKNGLFRCSVTLNLSTCISNERLLDGFTDCGNSRDETIDYTDVCALNLSDRFQCINTNQCIPRRMINNKNSDCLDESDEYHLPSCGRERNPVFNEFVCYWLRGDIKLKLAIPFLKLCDGIVDLKEHRNMTDETNCEQWPCHTTLTNCSGTWNCPNAVDEINCTNYEKHFGLCSYNESYCVQKPFDNMTCYNLELAGDNVNNCLGNVDERVNGYCRLAYPGRRRQRFQCQNSSICLDPKQLCDCRQDCPYGDDEKALCNWLTDVKCDPDGNIFYCQNGEPIDLQYRCDSYSDCDNSEDEWLCDIVDDTRQTGYFLQDINFYPVQNYLPLIDDSTKAEKLGRQSKKVIPLTVSRTYNDKLYFAWYCNRGLVAQNRRTSKDFCLCPSTYYGPRCEYQRKRISLIVLFYVPMHLYKKTTVINFVFYLVVKDTSEIIDYEQIKHVSHKNWYKKYYFYLLYPKNAAESIPYSNYYIRIDAYSISADDVKYITTWYYILQFPFLPVHRITLKLVLEQYTKINNKQCKCAHGTCIKYSNDGVLMVVIGLLLNILTIITFYPTYSREIGCTLYILCSSIIGQASLFVLSLKLIQLILTPINNSSFTLVSCITIEYFLRLFPALCDWLNAFVSCERAYSVNSGLRFDKRKSKKCAKLAIILLLIISVSAILHEPFHRHILVDPRINRRVWCVVRYENNNRLKQYNLAINLINYIVPFTINLLAAISILISSTKKKSQAKHEHFRIIFRKQFHQYKHLISSPILLLILALP
ncbi:unnamed protein product, partial [Didymodactylos carnosus]